MHTPHFIHRAISGILNRSPGAEKLLPITGMLNPLGGVRNIVHLAVIAALTRMAVGVVRVMENDPKKQHDPHLSLNQKRQAFLERIFVEIFGTAGYMLFLHLGQDLAAKVLEARIQIPKIMADGEAGLTTNGAKTVQTALEKFFGTGNAGLIYRALYGSKHLNLGQRASMKAVREAVGEDLFRKAAPQLEAFSSKVNRSSSVALLAGVFFSALFGGAVTQWANDHVIAPLAQRFLRKRYGDTPATPSCRIPVVTRAPAGNTAGKLQAPTSTPPPTPVKIVNQTGTAKPSYAPSYAGTVPRASASLTTPAGGSL